MSIRGSTSTCRSRISSCPRSRSSGSPTCATLLKEKFSQWVKHRSDNRHEYVAEKGDLNIEMDPEIAEVYKNSNAVSSKCLPQPMLLKILSQLINLMFYSLQGSLRTSL